MTGRAGSTGRLEHGDGVLILKIMKKTNHIKNLLQALILSSFPLSVAAADEAVPRFFGQWPSVLPPLLAIGFALAFRRVIPALFLALWLGAWLLHDLSLPGLGRGLLDTVQVFAREELADSDHAAIIIFTLMIGGMVGIISRNGGMQGIVESIVRWADDARHACLATAGMGMAIFFDDYANTLVVGNTMRPVTDAMNVSREKLAYIVDSTAAPVACIALVTTWVGYEVGLIGDAIGKIDGFDMQAYLVYLNTLPYSFYPILALSFVFMVCFSGRDFGPMHAAEVRARGGQVAPSELGDSGAASDAAPIRPVGHAPRRALNAIVPVAVMIGAVIIGLYVTGKAGVEGTDAGLREIIGAADSYTALMWASLLGVLTGALLSLAQRILTLEQVVDAWYRGLRSMIKAMIILILAWSIGTVTAKLGTSEFLVQVLGDTLPAWTLPALVFLLAAGTGFGTGSSWGAMGILVPLVVPLTWAVMESQGLTGPEHWHLLFSSIASVLAGSVWGDHCSPISDTTILSSLASGCDHVEHVRTQLPYAGIVGLVSIGLCSIPVALGLPWWAGIGLSLLLLGTLLRVTGRPAEGRARETPAAD
jgi:Na+/H+ antiporter NhaC